MRKGMLLLLLFCSALMTHGVRAADVAPPRPTWGHRLLWYLPNRAMDVVDLFRFRVRAGPGNALSLRATKPVSLFAGSYHAWYLGLPGPRYPEKSRPFWGREEYVGIEVSTADATDENPYEPDYTRSEIGLGLHLVYVGADLGTDPVEWWDLLAGLAMQDPRGDDR